MNKRISCYLNCLPVLLFTSCIFAASGEFSTLTYNIAGLPEIVSSAESHRLQATEQISCYINEFDIVNVQEDFNYHAALYDTCNHHDYRSPTSGGAGIGSGLNTLSHFPYEDWSRIRWSSCHGVDCLTPKGFTLARVQLQEGVYVDVYNLHAQAQTEPADLKARRENMLQLSQYIEIHSAGNAVIITGDTNTRYTRSGDNIREFIHRGFKDAWLTLIRDNDAPVSGADALVCHPPFTGSQCEIVDKVLYRDNGYLNLSAYTYEIRQDAKTSTDLDLSDHPPVEARWTYQTNDNWQFSPRIGGPHGIEFNDYALLPDQPSLSQISIRSGKRLDQLQLTLSNGETITHGANGGTRQSLAFNPGEYLTSATFCAGKWQNHTRIFYTRLTTNQSRSLSGGTQTDTCQTFDAPENWHITGFYGRSADEIDKVGVIYSPLRTIKASGANYAQMLNQASQLCLSTGETNLTEVDQQPCENSQKQLWHYDPRTGLLRNRNHPEYCLSNGGSFTDHAKLLMTSCTGNVNQQFTISSDGSVSMRTMPDFVIRPTGSTPGESIFLSSSKSLNIQRWQWQ
ncbi:Ricin-type beta-trefoil lectin domain protein [Vibrio quintilis]|uniref:Ricin-type beta-trefoil lectin domain protein n=2 Tax=Vibrio quintilis TaxID=1117707 RepID=A0A1M7Z043_9VIBR|nr:Ricin-type beta-trefoil lectin domain protein [Vibrio quintilis]